jgi:galactokinase
MDQAASLLGRAGHALLLDCGTLEYRYVAMPQAIALLVVESGIERRLSETPYAQRRRELEAGHPRRVRHVESENQRVRQVVDALERDDRRALALLFATSHASLRDDFEVSTPELDLLVERALAAGAFAARLTGAGFGGSVLALADADQASDVAARLADVYTVHRCSSAGGASEL